jgi:Zn-dependent peptidase ImmA (M78 family)/DNA-binding XRE family transcriptional regulator
VLEATDRPSPEIQLGERLRQARELAGFAQGEAAQALGITSAALSQYEGGKRRIEALTLDRIARLYGVPITYFFADTQTDQQTDWEMALRSLANTLSAAGKAGVAKLIQRIHDLEHLYAITGLPFPGKPHPPFPSLPKEGYADYKVAEFAQKVRRYYNLGIAPLLNVKLFLDAQGYQVFGIPFGKEEPVLSGLFFLHPQLGAIVVFNEDQSYTREPFTLCHEMAHSLFHWDRPAILCRDSERADLVEDFANRFASYFLIPREGLQERLDVLGIKTVKQPKEVIHIARYFGVSYDATLHSLDMERKLGVPRDSLKTKPIALAKTLGYKPSPFEFGVRPLPPEERLPRIFLELGYRAIDSGLLSLRRVAEMMGISDLELEERLGDGEVEEMEDVYI